MGEKLLAGRLVYQFESVVENHKCGSPTTFLVRQPHLWFTNHICGSPTTNEPQMWFANHKRGSLQILKSFWRVLQLGCERLKKES